MEGKPTHRALILILVALTASWAVQSQAGDVVHDAEYYVLEAQNGERWAAEDKELDAKLAELKAKHGTPPNIVYLLWDDTQFGAVGFPALQKNFGYETPNINKMGAEVRFVAPASLLPEVSCPASASGTKSLSIKKRTPVSVSS